MSGNPFGDSSSNVHNVDGGASFAIDDKTPPPNPFDRSSTPSVDNPFNQYGDSSNGGHEDLQAWNKSLDEREDALQRKLKDLDKRGTALKRSVNNWPLPFLAITYHNINDEIPERYRVLMRQFYILWIVGAANIFWNWICSCGVWANDPGDNNPGVTGFFIASIFVIAHVVFSWSLWYRSIYRATGNEKAKRWIFFFINFGMYMGWIIFLGLGVPDTGAYGIIIGLDLITRGVTGWGGMCMICFGVWAASLLAAVFLIKQAHSAYRNRDGDS